MNNKIQICKVLGLILLTLFFLIIPPLCCGVFSAIVMRFAILNGLSRWIGIISSGLLAFILAYVWNNWANKHIYPRIKQAGDRILDQMK